MTQETAVDYGRKWFVMAAVGMGISLATIDSSIVNVALPTLVRELDTDFATVQWVVLAYLLTVATLMLSIGRLADMIGKKPIYMTGIAVFTIGSALCGLAPTIYGLIGFRVLQAVGAAMTTALGLAIVTEAFPAEERGKALGIAGGLVSIGIVTGPTLGGLLLDALSWRWIFFVNLPVGLVGTLMVLRFVPALKPARGQRFDFAGAVTLFVSLLSLLLALTLGQQEGFADTRVLSLFAAWAIFLTLFVVVEQKSAQPMIDLCLFQNTLFSINLITGFLTFLALSGTIILMPFFLENVLGYGPRAVGLMLASVPLGFAVMSPISGSLSDRFGTRPMAAIGLAVTLMGYYAISSFDADTTQSGYILNFLPIAIGMGIFSSPNNSAILGAVPRERLGVASGLLALTRSLGQTTGIAVLGALWTGRVLYHAGPSNQSTATDAPTAAQVAGLHDTLLVIIVLGIAALAFAVWALVQERRERSRLAIPLAAD